MTLSDPEPQLTPDAEHLAAVSEQEERKRRRLLLLLLLLLLALCLVLYFTVRYLFKPAPVGDMLPAVVAQSINYPPAYKFSILGVMKPQGVALSADGQRVYVTEGGGEFMIKMFDRDGKLIQSFAPPGTTAASRLPSFIAVHPDGRVFVSDRLNQSINVFDPDGNFIDAIIGQDKTISKIVAAQNNGTIPAGTTFFYNMFENKVYYQLPDQDMKTVEITNTAPWNPVGIHFDPQGNLLVTTVNGGDSVLIFPAEAINGSWKDFSPQVKSFGEAGKGDGQLSFPNAVVSDKQGNFYVSDGNNGRISMWTSDMKYKTFFGFGADETSFNLPRGMWIDDKERLHIADAVGQNIHVYDVSKPDPVFLFTFGDFGNTDGLMNFPNDVTLDSGGRLYIADRENNRVQIWSY
jgi:DNA-binding beta-propeller fold protein YncE